MTVIVMAPRYRLGVGSTIGIVTTFRCALLCAEQTSQPSRRLCPAEHS